MTSYLDSGTPSKSRRRGQSPFAPTSILLSAAIALGLFTVCIVGFAMHPMLLEDKKGAGGRRALPGDDASTATATTLHRSAAATSLRPGCADVSKECSTWAADGQCTTNPAHMFRNCLASCGGCDAVYLHSVPPSVELFPGERYEGGLKMPSIGFGTAGLSEYTANIVVQALAAGYRRIDSAQAREWYREDLVGQALRNGKVPRENIFITTKVHPRDLGARATISAVERSFGDLGTNYVDLVLLHYAECWGDLCQGKKPEGTWTDR